MCVGIIDIHRSSVDVGAHPTIETTTNRFDFAVSYFYIICARVIWLPQMTWRIYPEEYQKILQVLSLAGDISHLRNVGRAYNLVEHSHGYPNYSVV